MSKSDRSSKMSRKEFNELLRVLRSQLQTRERSGSPQTGVRKRISHQDGTRKRSKSYVRLQDPDFLDDRPIQVDNIRRSTRLITKGTVQSEGSQMQQIENDASSQSGHGEAAIEDGEATVEPVGHGAPDENVIDTSRKWASWKSLIANKVYISFIRLLEIWPAFKMAIVDMSETMALPAQDFTWWFSYFEEHIGDYREAPGAYKLIGAGIGNLSANALEFVFSLQICYNEFRTDTDTVLPVSGKQTAKRKQKHAAGVRERTQPSPLPATVLPTPSSGFLSDYDPNMTSDESESELVSGNVTSRIPSIPNELIDPELRTASVQQSKSTKLAAGRGGKTQSSNKSHPSTANKSTQSSRPKSTPKSRSRPPTTKEIQPSRPPSIRVESAPRFVQWTVNKIPCLEVCFNNTWITRRIDNDTVNLTFLMKSFGDVSSNLINNLAQDIVETKAIGPFRGSWVSLAKGLEIAKQHGFEDALVPLFNIDVQEYVPNSIAPGVSVALPKESSTSEN